MARDELMRDVRLAWRSLWRTPGVTAVAIASLTLGIATTTTVFSLFDAGLLRQPPFERADRLAVVYITRSSNDGVDRTRWSWRRFQLLRGMTQSFDDVASATLSVVTLTGVLNP